MEYKLWENGTPGYREDYGQPEPTMVFYPANEGKGEPRGCVIVAPGGGYVWRAGHEGEPIAQMLNEAGIHAFVLNYRVDPYRYPIELYDIQRAVRYARFHANKFGIKKDKIGILGFSAGGHLCTMGAQQYDYGKEDGDEIDKVSCRPDAAVLCYAVISLISFFHEGSRDFLLGPEHGEETAKMLSGELAVRDDMPPVFMWHTAADQVVPVENALNMALALSEKKIPFELHVFPDGEHGLGLSPNLESAAQWVPLVKNWLLRLGF